MSVIYQPGGFKELLQILAATVILGWKQNPLRSLLIQLPVGAKSKQARFDGFSRIACSLLAPILFASSLVCNIGDTWSLEKGSYQAWHFADRGKLCFDFSGSFSPLRRGFWQLRCALCGSKPVRRDSVPEHSRAENEASIVLRTRLRSPSRAWSCGREGRPLPDGPARCGTASSCAEVRRTVGR